MIGAAGGDTLDGGTGFDVAAFSGNRADYVVTLHRASSGEAAHVTVEHTVAGRDGTDTVVLGAGGATVERLRFADGDTGVIASCLARWPCRLRARCRWEPSNAAIWSSPRRAGRPRSSG